MAVHVISVGLSLFRSLEDPDKLTALGQKPELIKAIGQASPRELLKTAGVLRAAAPGKAGEAVSDWLSGALARPAEQRRDHQAADLLAATAAAIKPEQWTARISAELDTFDRARRATIPLGKKDTAVLVCTDTAEDLLAGLWNAVALSGGARFLSRIRYLPDPPAQLGSVRNAVLLTRIRYLDASSDSGFARAMRGLGTLGRALLDAGDVDPGDPFLFYLSGGYKAAIPYLIGLAEGVRSAAPDREVEAFVLHETSEARAIRLPLRRMPADCVWEELREFDDRTGICHGEIPEPRTLEGYAYEKDTRKTFRLTPFGEGLRTLFPRLHEQIK
ncbi:MAG TPA: hypothetical protein VFQ44_08370 [Streptosporangiaceae bacterium]|nr:hypothetical protein [Streptosporangiaceae bacterium]